MTSHRWSECGPQCDVHSFVQRGCPVNPAELVPAWVNLDADVRRSFAGDEQEDLIAEEIVSVEDCSTRPVVHHR